jgi:DNA-binding response OmpR family regulator
MYLGSDIGADAMLVLIVEDEPLISMTLEHCVLEAGFQVLGPVATSTDALRLSENVRPDLALVDLHLRDGSTGLTVARELMARWGTPSLFLSVDEELRAKADVGLGFVEKPVEWDALLSCIKLAERLVRGEKLALEDVPEEMKLFERLHRTG